MKYWHTFVFAPLQLMDGVPMRRLPSACLSSLTFRRNRPGLCGWSGSTCYSDWCLIHQCGFATVSRTMATGKCEFGMFLLLQFETRFPGRREIGKDFSPQLEFGLGLDYRRKQFFGEKLVKLICYRLKMQWRVASFNNADEDAQCECSRNKWQYFRLSAEEARFHSHKVNL